MSVRYQGGIQTEAIIGPGYNKQSLAWAESVKMHPKSGEETVLQRESVALASMSARNQVKSWTVHVTPQCTTVHMSPQCITICTHLSYFHLLCIAQYFQIIALRNVWYSVQQVHVSTQYTIYVHNTKYDAHINITALDYTFLLHLLSHPHRFFGDHHCHHSVIIVVFVSFCQQCHLTIV